MVPRTIVFVLDSLDSLNDAGLTWALSLARWYESDLHVVLVRRSGRADAVTGNAAREPLVGRIDHLVAESGGAGVHVVPAVLSGRPVRAIAEYSRRVAADLVAVTNRPRRSSGYWLAGSFATALGKAVASPTIALPDGLPLTVGPGSPFRNIVTAVDFSEASLLALSEALNLAQWSGGHLRLVHVLSAFLHETVYGGAGSSRLRPRVGASVARIDRELWRLIPPDALNWSTFDTTTVTGDAREGILTVASLARADVIVLGLPRRSRAEELVAGTTVHGILRRATSPVLLVPGPPTRPRFHLTEERDVMLGFYQSALGAPGVGRRAAKTSCDRACTCGRREVC